MIITHASLTVSAHTRTYANNLKRFYVITWDAMGVRFYLPDFYRHYGFPEEHVDANWFCMWLEDGQEQS